MDCCLLQGLSLLLAMILKALGPHQYYDSDDEYVPDDRVPLLKNAPPPYVVVDQGYGHGPKNDAWIRVSDKVNKDWNSLIDHNFLIQVIFVFLYHLY